MQLYKTVRSAALKKAPPGVWSKYGSKCLFIVLVMLLQACKQPLAIEGEGDIVDLNGSSHGCTLEEFQAEDVACTQNEVSGEFQISYQAVPREGWRFVKWEGGWCSRKSIDPVCVMDFSAATVAFWDSEHADVVIPATTAVFEPEGALALYRDQVAEVDQYLRDIEFSGSVLIGIGDDTLLARGYGLADRDKGHTNRSDTRFRIASMTKTFTAGAIMLLEERQLLRTDDSLCDYLQECPATWQAITLEHLLLHTSGIPDYVTDFWQPGDPYVPWDLSITKTGVLDTFVELPLEFPPGSDWDYSNSGYFLLGLVIEAASGVSYSQFLQDNIFGPLGMEDTGIHVVKRSKLASPYDVDYDVPRINPVAVYSAGAMYSTVVDLQRWERAMHSDVLLSDSTRAKLLMNYVELDCPGSCTRGHTYGWKRENWSGIDIFWHDGFLPGWNSMLLSSFQEEHPSVIVLQNSTGDNQGSVVLALDIGRMISGYDPRL